jgi:hypothetical protein
MESFKFSGEIANKSCAIYPYQMQNILHIECLTIIGEGSNKFWADLELLNNPNSINFKLVNFGKHP